MTTFKKFVTNLNNTNTVILSKDSENKFVKFIADIKSINRTVYALVQFDSMNGIKIGVDIPSGCSGYEKLAVKKEIKSIYGLN